MFSITGQYSVSTRASVLLNQPVVAKEKIDGKKKLHDVYTDYFPVVVSPYTSNCVLPKAINNSEKTAYPANYLLDRCDNYRMTKKAI